MENSAVPSVSAEEPTPPPSSNPVSRMLHITKLVRPYTVPVLKEMLRKSGTILDDSDHFWIDGIKSQCIVTVIYSNLHKPRYFSVEVMWSSWLSHQRSLFRLNPHSAISAFQACMLLQIRFKITGGWIGGCSLDLPLEKFRCLTLLIYEALVKTRFWGILVCLFRLVKRIAFGSLSASCGRCFHTRRTSLHG